MGFVDVDLDGYGGLRLSPAAMPVLRGEQTLQLREVSTRKRKSSLKQQTLVDAADEDLFENLRLWRKQTAEEQGVPPYVIFHDATLAAIASLKPDSIEALGEVPGIGAKKLDAYGWELLRLLRAD